MHFNNTVFITYILLHLCCAATIFPISLQTLRGTVSNTPVSALQTRDQSGNQDSWGKYVEFYGEYQGVITFDASALSASSSSFSLDINYRGPVNNVQVWKFEILETSTNTWVLVGNSSAAPSWKWCSLSFSGTTRVANILSNSKIQVRFSSTNARDDCNLDYVAIVITDGASPTFAPSTTPTAAPITVSTPKPTTKPTAAPTQKATPAPTHQVTPAPTQKATPAPTQKATPAPTQKATPAPTQQVTPAPTQKATPVPTQQATNPPSTGGRICPPGKIWAPAPGTTWQWQLTGTIDQSIDVQMYDIDLFDASVSVIASLHQKGRAVICYFSTQYENWRPDAASFPASILGANLDDWQGERYVDIRSPILRNIMTARLDLAVSKGCDGVEPDNVDGYANSNGLGLTASDQLAYNKFLAQEAHNRGLSIGLKNDLDQVAALQPFFDWALNEQCNQYGECNYLRPFVQAGKAVFGVEYSGSASDFCPSMVSSQFSWLLKDLKLGVKLTECCTYAGGCARPAHQCIEPTTTVTPKRSLEQPVDDAIHSSSHVVAPVVVVMLAALALAM